jgi:tetratricopeptide (TPR) repeat protein
LLKGDFNDKPAIKIYLSIYQTLSGSDNQDVYFELLEQLQHYSHLFKQKEQRDMFVFAQNYCIKRINGGYEGAIEQMFDLYQMMVSKKLIYEGKFVSQPDFKNIITVGLRLNKIEWVEQFIADFKNDLNPEFAENASTYSQAWIHFSRKEYDKARRMLLKVEFNDVYYHLDSKSLLLKVYYEMSEFDAFFSLVDAFRIYLKRNKFISETQRNTYQNFVNMANKLMKMKSRGQKFTSDLIEEINNTKPMADLVWLQMKTIE